MADEPTGNLDSETSYEVMAILQNITAQGKTVILVTHEPGKTSPRTRRA